MQKYKFTGETKEVYGRTLHQIVCVTAFASVAAGEVGGYIEKEVNLSQDGNAWVSGNAKVSGDAKVFGDAEVSGDAEVFGNAILRRGSTETATDYIVIGPQGSRRSFATLHLPSNTVCTGCFVGNLNEFKKAVYKNHNPDQGRVTFNNQYQRVIRVFEFLQEQDKDAQ